MFCAEHRTLLVGNEIDRFQGCARIGILAFQPGIELIEMIEFEIIIIDGEARFEGVRRRLRVSRPRALGMRRQRKR